MAHLTNTGRIIDARGLSAREVNARLRELAREGTSRVDVHHPAALHNLGVALRDPLEVVFHGSVGYFCGALGEHGPRIEVHGNAGWSLGADLMDGFVRVHGNSGASTAASARGGTIVVDGDAGPRTGIALKGATVVVGGDTGYMTGFQMQSGTIVVCGDAADGFGDSMYQGTLFCGGTIAGLGADAEVAEPSEDELGWLKALLGGHGLNHDRPWQKVTSAGRLWRFDKRDLDLWRQAL